MIIKRVGIGVSINVGLSVTKFTTTAIFVDTQFELDVSPLTGEALAAFVTGFAWYTLFDVSVDVFVCAVPIACGNVKELFGADGGEGGGEGCSHQKRGCCGSARS